MGLWPKFKRDSRPPPKRKGPPPSRVPPRAADPTRISDALDVPAGGHMLRAVTIGPGPKYAPTLVFLHEGLGCIPLWRDFPRAVIAATGYNAILYERYGYGGSEMLDGPVKPDFMEHEAHVVLPAVLDFFGIETAVLLGHSDGGSIALMFAGAFPARARAVITLAAHAYVEEATIEGVRTVRAAYEADDRLETRLRHYHGDNTEALVEGWTGVWLSPEFRSWSIEARLAEVKAPALIIQGGADEFATPEHLARIGRGLGGPVTELLIEGAGHTPQRDAEARVVEAITRFVKDLPPL